MLDEQPVVVDHVQGAVRTDVEVDRPEPAVGRREELHVVAAAARDEGGAVGGVHVAVHQVVHGFGDERVLVEGGREGAAVVEREPACRGELSGLGQQVEARRMGDGDDVGVAVVGDVGHRAREQQLRVALEISGGDHLVTGVDGVVVREVAAVDVERVAVLRPAGEAFQLERVGLEADAAATRVHGGDVGAGGKGERGALVAEEIRVDDGLRSAGVREVHPVVEAVDRVVHRVLRVGLREAGDHHFAMFGAPVAVAVGEEQQVGRARDEDAVLPAHHAARQDEPVGEDGAPVDAAVAVGVFEQPDASGRADVERIAGHLDDEDAAVLVDVHGDGALDVGFGGDEFDAEAGLDAQHVERLFRGVGRACGPGLAGEGAGAGPEGKAQRAGSGGAADDHDVLHGVRSRFGHSVGSGLDLTRNGVRSRVRGAAPHARPDPETHQIET